LDFTFVLRDGEYEFLAGYGGGVHAGSLLVSEHIGFDIEPRGNAVFVPRSGDPTTAPATTAPASQ
jgi:hypothetical protein